MRKKPPRQVFIHVVPSCIWVLYADRKKYQRHSPAQFDPRVMSVEQVREWVLARPEQFELIDIRMT